MDSKNNSSMPLDDLVIIDPLELKFPFELKKQISCSFQLSNKTDNPVAFKVKTTNPKKYSVRPNNGIVLPRSQSNVTVTMQAQREAPPDMQCNDKFLVQSVAAPPGATLKDITADMFNKEVGRVEECKLKVAYVQPPRPPSPVPEESEEDPSENTTAVSRGSSEHQTTPSKANDLISTLTKEKQAIIQENNRLQQELKLLKKAPKRSSSRLSIYYVLLIALLGILLGYYIRNL